MAARSKDCANRGKFDVAQLLAVEIEELQLGSRVLLVLREKFSAVYCGTLKHSISLRDQFLPVLAIVVPRVGDEEAIARGVFIRRDVEFAVVDLAAVEKIFARSDTRGRSAGFQVHQIKLGLGPALFDGDEQPVAVVGELHIGPVFGVAAFAENRWVFIFGMGVAGVVGDLVIEDVAVVHFLAGGDVSFFRIAGVVEAGVVEPPGDAGGAGALDGVGKNSAGFGFDDVQRAHLGTAGRQAIGDVLSVFAGLVPVERDGAIGGEQVGVKQDAVGTVEPISHIEDGLVLHALAARIKIMSAGDLRDANAADGE